MSALLLCGSAPDQVDKPILDLHAALETDLRPYEKLQAITEVSETTECLVITLANVNTALNLFCAYVKLASGQIQPVTRDIADASGLLSPYGARGMGSRISSNPPRINTFREGDWM